MGLFKESMKVIGAVVAAVLAYVGAKFLFAMSALIPPVSFFNNFVASIDETACSSIRAMSNSIPGFHWLANLCRGTFGPYQLLWQSLLVYGPAAFIAVILPSKIAANKPAKVISMVVVGWFAFQLTTAPFVYLYPSNTAIREYLLVDMLQFAIQTIAGLLAYHEAYKKTDGSSEMDREGLV